MKPEAARVARTAVMRGMDRAAWAGAGEGASPTNRAAVRVKAAKGSMQGVSE